MRFIDMHKIKAISLAFRLKRMLLSLVVASGAILAFSSPSAATAIKTIKLNNKTAPWFGPQFGRRVCVVGVGSGYTLAPPSSGNSSWTKTTGAYPAFPLSAVQSVDLAPAGATSFAAARLYFFLSDSSRTLGCDSIKFNPGNPTSWPQGFAEYTLAADGNLILNISNVDGFQIFLEAVVGPNNLLSFGNPVNPNSFFLFARNVIASYPAWIAAQSEPGNRFGVLSQTATYPGTSTKYSYIASPNAYLQQKDAKGAFVNYASDLSAYYDQRLSSFFSGAVNGATRLKVMGDSWAPLKQQPWVATSNTATCPLFLVPNSPGASLRFDYDSTGKHYFILCNPAKQVVDLTGTVSVTSQSGHTAKVKLPADQCSKVKKGLNIAQVETNWVGQAQSTCDGSNNVSVVVVRQSQRNRFSQVPCDSADAIPACSNASGEASYHWIVSNIPWSLNTSPWEKPTQMVFGNDGVFASWAQYLPADVADPDAVKVVAQSVVRNIVNAFSRGIENCNNVTKPLAGGVPGPANCANVKPLPAGSYVTGAETASDAYWSNQANWYPSGGYQNYYSQYLHTGCATPLCYYNAKIFELPNGRLPTIARSNQGASMAMAYGFPFDENPVYLNTGAAPAIAQAYVPSKLDPIPPSWNASTLTINVGPY